LQVFLIRDEDNNAAASDNGIIYVNIGLLANAPDEAALVCVLGHEISHTLNNDQKKSYQLENKQKKKNLKAELSTSHGNRVFESRADDYGFNVASSLGYNIKSEYQTILKFESDFNWYKSQYSYENPKWMIYVDKLVTGNAVHEDSLENLLSDHPDNFNRIQALKKFSAQKNGENQFIVNKELFNTIKQKAKIEQLYIDFTEGDYLNCIKNAFYYHLLDQQNHSYIYYVSESLRRLLQNQPNLYRKGFLTHENKDPIFEKNKGVLHNVGYLSLDSSFIAMVVKDTLYGKHKKPFETYSQACNFFIKKGISLKVDNILLTSGLYNLCNQNTKQANLNFTDNLKLPNANNIEFTKGILDGTLLEGFENYSKNLILIEDPNYYYQDQNKINYSFIESEKAKAKLNEMLTQLIKTKHTDNDELLFEDALNIVDDNFYTNLTQHLQYFKTEKDAQNEYLSAGSTQDKDYWNSRLFNNPNDPEVIEKQKNFFYLNPEYWQFFKQKEIASISKIVPYIYNVKTITGNKTYFYFELQYFNPINKKYVYFEQEYLEKYTKENIQKVLKKFNEKINNKTK
jgi:hypothetical protein